MKWKGEGNEIRKRPANKERVGESTKIMFGPHRQYLELDVVHRWRGHHAVEGGEAMLVANLLAVQLELRLTHLPVHIQSDHSLRRDTRGLRPQQ